MLKLGCRQNMTGMETKRTRRKCWFVSFAELSCWLRPNSVNVNKN